MWSSPENPNEVHGFILMSRINEIDAELSKRLRLYLISDLRTLTLEAPSLSMLSEWMQSFKFALQQRDADQKEGKHSGRRVGDSGTVMGC